jgi:hypothetical protein
MPHTFPGSSSANPNSQDFSYCPIEMQFTTRAVTLVPAGRPPKRSVAPIVSGRANRTAHPWGFTRMTTHWSENGRAGSRLVRVIGISQGMRVPRPVPLFVSLEPTFKFIDC